MKTWRFGAAVLACSVFCVGYLGATTFVNRPLGQTINEAEIIVRGTAGASESNWDREHKNLFTYTSFDVAEVLKGALKESRISLRQPGGSKDGIEMHVPGTAQFSPGEEAVVLLGGRNSEDDSYDVPGFTTGKYNVRKGDSGETILVNSLGGAAIYDPGKRADTVSYNSRIPLEVFRQLARGQEVPEASKKQFDPSAQAAPAGSFEADHHRHVPGFQAGVKPNPAAQPAKHDAHGESAESARAPRSETSFWVPLSFGVGVVLMVLLIWIFLNSGPGGGATMLVALLGFEIFWGATGPRAEAFVLARNATGATMRWPAPVRPQFVANWSNRAGILSYTNVFDSLTHALQRWKYSASADVDFDYVQSGTNPTSWGYDGKNAVFFSSQAPAGQKLASSTLGVTYVYSSGGVILETDMELNDEAFRFSVNPTDSAQWGTGGAVFLESVATHEFGHAFGLTHSGVLQSSMVFVEHRGQAKLGCDDVYGIASLYPSREFLAGRGSISGSVAGVGGAPIFGAHVLAISKTRATVMQGALTAADGTFVLENLEPGDYYLLVEPFEGTAPLSALCGGSPAGCYYGTINSSTACPGSVPFRRGFFQDEAGIPRRVSVAAAQVTAVGQLPASCSPMTDAWAPLPSAIGTAPVLVQGNAGGDVSTSIWSVIGSSGGAQYFRLSQVVGRVRATVMVWALLEIRSTRDDTRWWGRLTWQRGYVYRQRFHEQREFRELRLGRKHNDVFPDEPRDPCHEQRRSDEHTDSIPSGERWLRLELLAH